MAMNWQLPGRTRNCGHNKDVLVRIGKKSAQDNKDRPHIQFTIYPDAQTLFGLKRTDRIVVGFDDDMHIIAFKKDDSGYALSSTGATDKSLRLQVPCPKWVSECKRIQLTYSEVNVAKDETVFLYPDKP